MAAVIIGSGVKFRFCGEELSPVKSLYATIINARLLCEIKGNENGSHEHYVGVNTKGFIHKRVRSIHPRKTCT